MAKQNYRAQMDANQGIPPDHPMGQTMPGPTAMASMHKAFVSKGSKSGMGAVLQPSPKSGGKKLGAKRTIRGAK